MFPTDSLPVPVPPEIVSIWVRGPRGYDESSDPNSLMVIENGVVDVVGGKSKGWKSE